jgi:hypothetical protein
MSRDGDNGAGAADRLASLFAALHRSGAKGWSVAPGGADVSRPDGAPSQAASRAASRRASRDGAAAASTASAATAVAAAHRWAAAARHSIEDFAELIRHPGSSSEAHDGPLSRSLSAVRQRSAAAAEAGALVGQALGQVVEGEREGAGGVASEWSPCACTACVLLIACTVFTCMRCMHHMLLWIPCMRMAQVLKMRDGSCSDHCFTVANTLHSRRLAPARCVPVPCRRPRLPSWAAAGDAAAPAGFDRQPHFCTLPGGQRGAPAALGA